MKFAVAPRELKITIIGTSYYATEAEVRDLCDVLAAHYPDLIRQALQAQQQVKDMKGQYPSPPISGIDIRTGQPFGKGDPGGLR